MKTQIDHLVIRYETHRVALLRLEEAARTEKDFEKVIKEWDRIDRNREDKEEKKEDNWNPNILEQMIEDFEEHNVFPRPQAHVWWRQLQSGNFIDKIFDCPHEIAELTSHKKVSYAIKTLKAEQKEVLYYRTVRQWSPQRIAAYRGQSDRNIRKLYATLIAKIHREMEKIPDEKPIPKDQLSLDPLQRICRAKS